MYIFSKRANNNTTKHTTITSSRVWGEKISAYNYLKKVGRLSQREHNLEIIVYFKLNNNNNNIKKESIVLTGLGIN